MSLISALIEHFRRRAPLPPAQGSIPALPGEVTASSERGLRPTPEQQIRYLYRQMSVDLDLRATIQGIRHMDRVDGRVKRLHNKVARDVIRGGLEIFQTTESQIIVREWQDFVRRLQLDRPEKLKSDARGFIMEGNLPLQWVLDASGTVIACVRMPAETIRPNVGQNGQFSDLRAAYSQYDLLTGRTVVDFPLWQLTMARFDPDNFDDLGCLGRPFLDASRTTWKKLDMTETDLVVRRRQRAPLRLSHVLEGATAEELDSYRNGVELNKDLITTDFYQNKKGAVTALQGDTNLDQIGDVVHLLDSFFAGTPLPKGLMGYTDGLARDILEDLKRDYYDEVDVMQDSLAWIYTQGFRLHLLLKGINPDADSFRIRFAERRTETASQTTDRALKLQALGMPRSMVWEELGYNAADVEKRRTNDADNDDPYPNAGAPSARTPTIKITPGNARKGESATDIGHGY